MKIQSTFFRLFIMSTCLASSAFADYTLIKNLKPEAEVSIKSYLEGDINNPDDRTAHSCRGNARSSGVEYLEEGLLTDLETFTSTLVLRGKVWVNSCEDKNGIHFYADSVADKEHCGYNEVQFVLPFELKNDKWIPHLDHITKDIEDPTPVKQIISLNLKQKDLSQYGFAKQLLSNWFCFRAQNNSTYPPLQFDIEEIFKRCTRYFELGDFIEV